MDLDIAFWNSHGHRQAPHAPLSTISSTPAKPSGVTPTSTVPVEAPPRINRSSFFCNNCKSTGHIDLTCFKEGGGMAGCREEYLNDKGRVHAMLAQCLEDAFLTLDTSPPPTPSSLPVSPITTLDDQTIVPVAAMRIPSLSANPDLLCNIYIPCDPKFPQLALSGSADFKSSAFVSLLSIYNSLLDSGCTHHIIWDQSLFSNYTSRAISVGTANCGSLQALGTGDVSFRCSFGNRNVLFTMHNCLHAPDAPINLVSVGSLVECRMTAVFSPGGITSVSFLADHPLLPNFSFSATVHNRLSLLTLAFVTPIHSTAMPTLTFPQLKLDSVLWHRRFGHIGMDMTRAVLTKDYVKGVTHEGPFTNDRCVACIVGKSPQLPYLHKGHRATKIGELLHMDICGPYPVKAPGGDLISWMIVPTLALLWVCNRKVMLSLFMSPLNPSLNALMVFWLLPFVLMELWNLLQVRWVLILLQRVLLFRRLPLMHTHRMARVNVTSILWKKVVRLCLQILVYLCLFGWMQCLLHSTFVTACQLLPSLLILLLLNLLLITSLICPTCGYGGVNVSL